MTELSMIINNYVKDTFFIKALMIRVPELYGDGIIGATYRFIVTDLKDKKYVVLGS